MSSRRFFSSQSTPLKGPPPSSSAVRGHDEVARGPQALLLVANQIRHPDGGLRLVISGASAVEVAVLLEQGEGIDAPVFALGFDDVEVGEEQ